MTVQQYTVWMQVVGYMGGCLSEHMNEYSMRLCRCGLRGMLVPTCLKTHVCVQY